MWNGSLRQNVEYIMTLYTKSFEMEFLNIFTKTYTNFNDIFMMIVVAMQWRSWFAIILSFHGLLFLKKYFYLRKKFFFFLAIFSTKIRFKI